MDSELDVVRQINKLAGQARPVDLMMDLITRYGHWAFLIYGMLLWFAPGKNQKHRRESCVAAFLAVCLCSVISLAVGKLWHRGAAFYPGPADLEFYRAQSECVFSEQSCHERRGRGLSASAGSYARMPVDGMPGRAACLFPVVCGDALSFGYSWRRRYCRGGSWGIKQTFCGCFHKKIDRSPVFII